MADLFPLLVADIGGTNARFGLVEKEGYRPRHVMTLRVADWPTLEDAIAHYVDQVKIRPVAGIAAIAGPVSRDKSIEIRFTNNPWRFTLDDIAERFQFSTFAAINDFVALASAAPHLHADEVLLLNDRQMPKDMFGFAMSPIAVVGPGTGMGVAALAPIGSTWLALPSEGGHVDLAVVTEEEIAVYGYLQKKHGRVSAEIALAGQGLTHIHSALIEIRGLQAEILTPAQITDAALLQQAGLERDAVLMTLALVGGFAGNVALTFGARSGVFLGGGILPRLSSFIFQSDLRARFEAKSPHEDYMREIPLRLIIAEESPALLGAAAWFAREMME